MKPRNRKTKKGLNNRLKWWPCLVLAWCVPGYADILTDGTVGGEYYLFGDNMIIPESYGTTVGNNLFHSFSFFNIYTGENATFTGSDSLQNVICRVTGGDASMINGALSLSLSPTVGHANFYFINPAGVTFGKNTVVDVPASFHVSTANQINFADGSVFSATNPAVSTLTVAAPASFGFLGQTGDIVLDGAQIIAKPNQTIDLVANNISLKNNADLYAPAGEVRLVAAKGSQNVSLVRDENGFLPLPSQTPDAGNAGNIFVDNSVIDTTGNGSGRAALWANNATFNNSIFSADNDGDLNASIGKGINIRANLISLDHSIVSSDTFWLGSAGNLNINAGKLVVENSGQITSNTYGDGEAGKVIIDAGEIMVDGQQSNYATIASDTYSDTHGNAGAVMIKADNLTVKNGGQISSNSDSYGKAGYIDINVSNLEVNGEKSGWALIISDTYKSNAQAGTIKIKADNLSIINGGQISTNTYSQGQAGNIEINADNVLIDGQKNGYAILSSDAYESSAGNAGTISLTGKDSLTGQQLTIRHGGQISSDSHSIGNGGRINIDFANLLIDGDGTGFAGILTDTFASTSAKAGQITINAGKLTLFDGGQIGSNTHSDGDAGKIIIHAGELLIDGKSAGFAGIISEALSGSGNAGTINITADNSITVVNNGQIASGTASQGNGGDVFLLAPKLTIDNAFIGAATSGLGNAGSVFINASQFLNASNLATISSSTYGAGNAGTVTVSAPMISLDNSSISAAAFTGSSGQTGNVTVTATQALNLTNNAAITLQNDASVANSNAIVPTKLTVTAPNINLTNSSITTASSGNIKASDIELNFSDRLLMDSSYILTTANTGDGGSIYINNSGLIYLKDSGFLTSVSGTDSNGGNIYVNADFLVMDTGVIQANAVGGSGGDVNLNLKGLIASYDNLILGGKRVDWQPFVPGFNVIQAASESGVNGTINLSSPQFDISGSISGLKTNALIIPDINNSPCQNAAGSSLKRGSKGGIPANETKTGFIPPVTVLPTFSNAALPEPQNAPQSKANQPCAVTTL